MNQFIDRFVITIAGLNIRVSFSPIHEHRKIKNQLKKDILKHLAPFITNRTDQIVSSIIVQDHEIYNVLYKDKQTYAQFAYMTSRNNVRTHYYISFTQFMLILSGLITNILPNNNGLMLHGSAALINNRAHIFLGKEGAGKSTIIKLLKNKYPTLTDDLVIIRKIGENFLFFQNPYIEKANWIKKDISPIEIGNIYILKKNPIIKMSQLNSNDRFLYLLKNLLLTNVDKKKFMKTFSEFTTNFHSCFELKFNLDASQIVNYLSRRHE